MHRRRQCYILSLCRWNESMNAIFGQPLQSNHDANARAMNAINLTATSIQHSDYFKSLSHCSDPAAVCCSWKTNKLKCLKIRIKGWKWWWVQKERNRSDVDDLISRWRLSQICQIVIFSRRGDFGRLLKCEMSIILFLRCNLTNSFIWPMLMATGKMN